MIAWLKSIWKRITCQHPDYKYDSPTLGGDWIRCTNCNALDEYLPGLHEPAGYTPRPPQQGATHET